MKHTSDTMQACIDACFDCSSVCLETFNYCLEKGGNHASSKHLRVLLDCAEICQADANFMLRNSPFIAQYCTLCAQVDRACAESCDRIGSDDVMKRCAEACRKCADLCQQMAGSKAA